MMVAIMSTAFTGQAIAVGFDRRYGALKRLGATPLPRWGIIAGKSAAVVIVVAMQSLLFGAIGFALGWRPEAIGLMLGAVVIALGTARSPRSDCCSAARCERRSFWRSPTCCGSSWPASAAWCSRATAIPGALHSAARIIPSGALAEALDDALAGSVDVFAVAVLALWASVAGVSRPGCSSSPDEYSHGR